VAYVDFYMDASTGNDLNSGSSSGSPVIVSGCSANNVAVSGPTYVCRITAGSGTPFSGVTAGQWASVYLSSGGYTVTSYISQIYQVNGGGSSIDLYYESSTPPNCFGSGDLSGAGNPGFTGVAGAVTARIGGPWASLNITRLSAAGSYAGGAVGGTYYTSAFLFLNVRVNVKSGTYSNSSQLTLPSGSNIRGIAGASVRPICWRGYATSPGDLDNAANPGTHPVFSFSSTANLIIPSYTRLENIDITTTGTANPLIPVTELGVMMTRCRVTATNSAITISGTAPGFNAWACYFTTTSTTVALVNCNTNNNQPTFNQCVFQGGLYNVNMAYNGSFNECLFRNSSSHLVYCTQIGMISQFYRCTFYNSGASSDAIHLSGINAQYLTVAYCIFANISRYAINVTDTAFVGCRIIGPDYYSITSGQLNGVYESYQHAAITESASPFTSASTNDFTLVSTSTAVTQTFVFEMP